MGEEEKKEEEKKEEGKKEKKEEKIDEKKEEKKEEASNEIVLKVDVHCEGCAKKVKRSLRGFEGVEEIQVDTKSHKVVVKGKAADPLKVLQRIEKKSGRKGELISPTLKSLEEAKKGEGKEKEKKQDAKPEEKKEEPVVITSVLNVHMHCENCSQEIRRIIEKAKGVASAVPDLKRQQVTVKGTFDPVSLVEYVHRRTGRHAEIVEQEAEKKGENAKEGKEEKEKKGKGGSGGEAKEAKEKKDGDGSAEKKTEEKKAEKKDGEEGEGGEPKTEIKKSEAPVVPKYAIDYVHAPQFFSDENPNACSIM